MVKEFEPVYKVKEAAMVLRTDPGEVYDMINTGKIPYILIKNAKRIKGVDLERYIDNIPTGGNVE